MTEITTFKGNWADFPGEPSFYGAALSAAERKKFDRVCDLAKEVRERCRQTRLDFNKKYLVVENSRHDPKVDYDKIAEAWKQGSVDEIAEYPRGGRVGDMVYFVCTIHADTEVISSRYTQYLNAEKTALRYSLSDRWAFNGITIELSMRCISIDGQHPCTGPDEWCLHCSTEPDDRCDQILDEEFTKLRLNFLDNPGYKLRPLSDAEAALYPNTEEDFCISRVIPN